jgi:hypothetical protein
MVHLLVLWKRQHGIVIEPRRADPSVMQCRSVGHTSIRTPLPSRVFVIDFPVFDSLHTVSVERR